jgi:two-component system, NarL family, nitrate/nitrite response regulator NarL
MPPRFVASIRRYVAAQDRLVATAGAFDNPREANTVTRAFHPDAAALVVDDHPLYRGALADLARTILGESAVVEADSAEAGLAAAAACAVLRLVLLDFRLPGLNGAEAVQEFRRRFPRVGIVVVSASEDRREADAAMRAGADAFLQKTTSLEPLAQTIRAVLAGAQVPPQWPATQAPWLFDDGAADLTARQREILLLLTQGLSNKEIGLRLGLAVITVKMHVSAIFRALGVVNRTQAALAARRLGIAPAAAGPVASS